MHENLFTFFSQWVALKQIILLFLITLRRKNGPNGYAEGMGKGLKNIFILTTADNFVMINVGYLGNKGLHIR
jgi:hypothetical protein